MMIQRIKEHGIFLLLITAFLIYAIRGINLPFYWDTGSFLIPAAHSIYQTHDLLRYTVAMTDYPHTFLLPLILSLFFNFFENPLQYIHFFSISISMLFLVTVYLTAKRIYPKEQYFPVFLVVAFITNALFLSQTDLVYFEIVGSLFRVIAIYFLSRNNFKYFFLFSLIAFFIRFENGLILPFIGLTELILFQRKNKRLLLANIILVLATFLWFLLHFMFTGWWIFSPERYFDEKPIQAILESLNYLLVWQGRYIYTLSIIAGILLYLLNKKTNIKNLTKNHKFLFLLMVNALPTLMIIGKLGYFLPRYIFPALLPFYMISYFSIKNKNSFIIAAILVFPIIQFVNRQNCFSYNFEDCTYIRNLLNAKVEAVRYLEKKQSDKLIYTYYEDNNTLENATLGYTKQNFTITTENNTKPELIYITPTSSGELYSYAKNNNDKMEKSINIGGNQCLLGFPKIPCKRNTNQYILIFTNEN